jgi:diguanylate cyclase (GGDEF)-like protein
VNAQVLIADRDPFNLHLLQEVCEGAGYDVVTADNGRQVLDVIARERPNLLLLGVSLPELGGFDVLRVLKADSELAHIPVILLTEEDDVDSRTRGIEYGAEEYLTKPYRVREIEQRLRNALRMRQAETAAEQANERARNADPVDPLTHAGTREQLIVSLDYEFARAARYRHPLSCLVVRVSNLKDIVEAAGQEAGDGVLISVSSGLRSCIRSIDHLFRSECDFTALLPETGAKGARVVLDRVQARAADHSLWGAEVQPLPAIALAYATYPDYAVHSGGELLEQAMGQLAGG